MDKILEVKGLKKYFQTPKGQLHAVDNVSFSINEGETLGLVGESGCGKSTTGRLVLRLLEASEGEILFRGEDIRKANKHKLRDLRAEMQIVFQDPYASLDSRKTVFESIEEPLLVHKKYKNRSERSERVLELMEIVGLASRFINAYPHEMDGGRRQRVGIARALALNPSFIVLDEPVSALDVSIQAQVLNLLQKLQQDLQLTYLFISHDLSVVKHISDRIAVMYLGKIVEIADYKEIFANPLHPYTKALLSAVPIPRLDVAQNRIILKGDVPSPINPPDRCRFCSRCYQKDSACDGSEPVLIDIGNGHMVACHLVRKN